jgi:hypothetical protein
MDAGAARSQGVVARFATYEEYLDSQTTNEDLEYLQDESLARRLVELGYRGSGETLKRYDKLHPTLPPMCPSCSVSPSFVRTALCHFARIHF